MKILHKIVLAAALFLSVSCAKENNEPTQEQELPAVITVGATSRFLGDENGDPEDFYINSLRILGYRTSNGTLAFNEMVVGLPASGANANTIDKKVDVITGNFTIIFIANEHEDPELSAFLQIINPIDPVTNKIAFLRRRAFSHTAFDATKNIPMSLIKENITIYADDTLIDPTQNSGNPISKWFVKLIRMGIRIDVKLSLTDDQKTAWLGVADPGIVYFDNIPEMVYIFPDINNYSAATMLTKNVTLAPATPPQDSHGLMWVFRKQRIMLPETNSPTLTEPQALTMRILEGAATPREGVITSGPGVYTIPRNHFVEVKAGISTAVVISALVSPWVNVTVDEDSLEGPI